MAIWQILDIESTNDEAKIKKAYRTQLRDCHPEENPEAFQKLRQAYEQALAFAKQCVTEKSTQSTRLENDVDENGTASQNTTSHQSSTTQKDTIDQNEKNSTAPKVATEINTKVQADQCQALYAQAISMLNNTQQRFDLSLWFKWQKQVLQTSLSLQSQLSDKMSQEILNWRWLPGDIIECLWQTFEWSSMLRETQYTLELGEFLDWWRHNISVVPLDYLSQLSHAEQRCILSYYPGLSLGLVNADLGQLSTAYNSHAQVICDHPSMARVHLKVLRALEITVSNADRLYLIQCLMQHIEALSDQDLILIASSSLVCAKQSLIHKIAKQLQQRNLLSQLATFLRDWYLPTNPSLALWYEARAISLGSSSMINTGYQPKWLAFRAKPNADAFQDELSTQVFEVGSYIRTILPLKTINGAAGKLIRLLWALNQGSWDQLKQCIAETKQVDEAACINDLDYLNIIQGQPSDNAYQAADWLLLADFLIQEAEEICASRPQYPIFDLLEKYYGKNHWFDIEIPTTDQFNAPTEQEWQDAYKRHPFIPLAWQEQLDARQDNEDWAYKLNFENTLPAIIFYYRNNIKKEWTYILGNKRTDIFPWIEFYYSFEYSNESLHPALIEAMQNVPEPFTDTALHDFWLAVNDPDDFGEKTQNLLSKWGDNSTVRIQCRRKVEALASSDISGDYLIKKALDNNEVHSLAALVYRRAKNRHELNNTIILWATLKHHPLINHAYNSIVSVIQTMLEKWLEDEGLTIDDKYSCTDETFIYSMINDPGWDSKSYMSYLSTLKAEEPHSIFTFPASYCVAMLCEDLSQLDYDSRIVKQLIDNEKRLSDDQKRTSNVVKHVLEIKLNKLIEADRVQSPKLFKRTKRYKTFSMLFPVILLFIFPLNIFPLYSLHYLLNLDNVIFFTLTISLIYASCRTRTNNREARKPFIYGVLFACLAIYGDSFFWSIPLWLSQWVYSVGINYGAKRNRWMKSFKKPKWLSLETIIK